MALPVLSIINFVNLFVNIIIVHLFYTLSTSELLVIVFYILGKSLDSYRRAMACNAFNRTIYLKSFYTLLTIIFTLLGGMKISNKCV